MKKNKTKQNYVSYYFCVENFKRRKKDWNQCAKYE